MAVACFSGANCNLEVFNSGDLHVLFGAFLAHCCPLQTGNAGTNTDCASFTCVKPNFNVKLSENGDVGGEPILKAHCCPLQTEKKRTISLMAGTLRPTADWFTERRGKR